MKRLKLIAVSAIAAAVLSGCGSDIDENKLIELTGNKNFQQVKTEYIHSLVNDKKEELKIYGYWLKENGSKAESTFNYDHFQKQLNDALKKEMAKLDKKMLKIKTHVDSLIQKSQSSKRYVIEYREIKKLSEVLKMAYFYQETSAYYKNTYIPFLKKQLQMLRDEREAGKKKVELKYKR
jgi:hypothetical protein